MLCWTVHFGSRNQEYRTKSGYLQLDYLILRGMTRKLCGWRRDGVVQLFRCWISVSIIPLILLRLCCCVLSVWNVLYSSIGMLLMMFFMSAWLMDSWSVCSCVSDWVCLCRPVVGVVSVGLNPEDHQSFPIDIGPCCRHRCSSYASCCNRFLRGVGFPNVCYWRRCQVPCRLNWRSSKIISSGMSLFDVKLWLVAICMSSKDVVESCRIVGRW